MFVLFLFTFLIGTNAFVQEEYDTLVNFYIEMSGDKWTVNTNWLNGTDYCTWYGITCTEEGRVYHIILDSNNLEGIIPDMSALQFLFAFEASGNKIKGDLSGFNNIKAFMAIAIEDNQLSGMANLVGTTMKWFHADNNQFTDIFYLVKNCPEIEVIGLTGNKVKTIPRQISSLKKLTTLALGNNEITSEIPDLSGLELVATIDLSGNKISGSIPETLGLLPKVTEIQLQNNKLSGSIPESLFAAPSLTLIDLSNNDLSGSLEPLLNSKTVVTAYLTNTKVEGVLPCLYTSSIRHLDLRGTSISCPIQNCNREIVSSDCGEKVIIHADVMSKCPDFGNFANKVAAPLIEKVGEIIDFSIGWIMSESSSYSTGYYSMHGNTEVIGNLMFSCALDIYNASKAFTFYNCMNVDIDYLPLGYTQCAIDAGIDVEAINKCAFGSRGDTLIKEAIQSAIDFGSKWCPTIYLNGEAYCLYNSSPCKAETIDDYIRDICAAYTGKTKPAACSTV